MQKTMTKTKKEIILETIEAYANPNNRATYKGESEGPCQYRTPEGRMCAVGRCMTNEALQCYGLSSRGIKTICWKVDINDLLKPEYQGHDIDFWYNLQLLHDAGTYWSEDGITEKGMEFIKERIGIDI